MPNHLPGSPGIDIIDRKEDLNLLADGVSINQALCHRPIPRIYWRKRSCRPAA